MLSISVGNLLSIIEGFSGNEFVIDPSINLKRKVFVHIKDPWDLVVEEIGNEVGFRVEWKKDVTVLIYSGDLSKSTGLITNKLGIKLEGRGIDINSAYGEGIIHYGNGMKYVGLIKNRKPNGFGKLYEYDGQVWLEGTWKNGILEGIGKNHAGIQSETKYGFKLSYRGEFSNNQYNGYGTWYSPGAGFVFEGQFLNGVPYGVGYYTDLKSGMQRFVEMHGNKVTFITDYYKKYHFVND